MSLDPNPESQQRTEQGAEEEVQPKLAPISLTILVSKPRDQEGDG
jgi:hypothetical protein